MLRDNYLHIFVVTLQRKFTTYPTWSLTTAYKSHIIIKNKQEKLMSKIISVVAGILFMATSAMADYTIYLPTKPGSGLDQWAQVVIKELKKHVDGDVKSVHIPGARHLIGMNKWNKENRFKEGAITVTGGTTSVNTLVKTGVEYDYRNWDAIGVQLLDIFVGKRKDWDPKNGGMVFGNDHAAGLLVRLAARRQIC